MKEPLCITLHIYTFTMLKVGEASKPWAWSCEDVNPCFSLFGENNATSVEKI